jgi:hypothetical protein
MTQLSIDFVAAEDRALSGMSRAADRADRANPGWTDQALTLLRSAARMMEAPFTIEAVRLVIEPFLPTPTDGRAWGAVTQAAIRAGVIEPTGEFARAASSNGSPKMLYRRGRAA